MTIANRWTKLLCLTWYDIESLLYATTTINYTVKTKTHINKAFEWIMQGIIVLTLQLMSNKCKRFRAYGLYIPHTVVISFKLFKCMYFCYNAYIPKRINKKKWMKCTCIAWQTRVVFRIKRSKHIVRNTFQVLK